MTTPRARGPGTVNAGPWWGTSMCAVQGTGCQGQGGGVGGEGAPFRVEAQIPRRPAFLPGWPDLRTRGVSVLAGHSGAQRGLPGSEWAAQEAPKPGAEQGSPQAPLRPSPMPTTLKQSRTDGRGRPEQDNPPQPPPPRPATLLSAERTHWPLGGAQRVP